MKEEKQQREFPPQEQEQPGRRSEMRPKPLSGEKTSRRGPKLNNKIALITGGDSGIGRAVAIQFAQEGANIAIVYKEEHEDAQDTRREIEKLDRRCILIAGDISEAKFCRQAVQQTVDDLGGLNVLVNNAAEQHIRDDISDISREDLHQIFGVNIFSMFYLTQAALSHFKNGDVIINTTSVTAYRGHPALLDYATTKGAIVAFTRSLALRLIEQGIRVNGVAPGPVWTPLIPGTFDAEDVEQFGKNAPMGRAGQPEEIAPCYVFLASDDSSYMTGQILHPNGGWIING